LNNTRKRKGVSEWMFFFLVLTHLNCPGQTATKWLVVYKILSHNDSFIAAAYVRLRWKEYQKTLEDADEKVQLANQIYELVNKH